MEYLSFDPTECRFPKSRVSILPTLSPRTFGQGFPRAAKLIGSNANTRSYTRGRYALTDAYRQTGVGKRGALLAPAYHCRTMLDPAVRLGGDIVLYALKPDLSPDMNALQASLGVAQQPVKAILLTHYFGFVQNTEPIAHFCRKNCIALIEDYSHTLFIEKASNTEAITRLIGPTGHFIVASPYKFFPCEDGGVIWTDRSEEHPVCNRSSPTLGQELKGFARSIQRSCEPRPILSIDGLDREIKALAGRPEHTGYDVLECHSRPSENYVDTEETLESLAWSRWVMRHTNVPRLANRRRSHYMQWADTVAELPHCKALFPILPPNLVPYMFPLHIDHPEPHFFLLKRLGVPVWRWDDLAVSNCSVATDYRLKVLHLPCHQELSAEQMRWMTAAVSKVMLCQVEHKR